MQGDARRLVLKVAIITLVNAIVVTITKPSIESSDNVSVFLSVFARITIITAAYVTTSYFQYTYITKDGRRMYATLLERKVKEFDDGEASAIEMLGEERQRCIACNRCKRYHFKVHLAFCLAFIIPIAIVDSFTKTGTGVDALTWGLVLGILVSSVLAWYSSKWTASKLQYNQFLQESLKSLGDGGNFSDGSDKRRRGGYSPTAA